MQNIKDKMFGKVREFIENNCNARGFVRKNNIYDGVSDGIKSLKERIKEKEIVVYATDKTWELTRFNTKLFERIRKAHNQ